MKLNDCKNFKGIQHKECKAGVDWKDMAGKGPGLLTRIPCLSAYSESATIECKHCDPATKEDVEKSKMDRDKWLEQMKVQMEKINPLIGSLKKENKSGGQGIIECPVCGSAFFWSVSSVNNHIRLLCEKEDCVNLME